jgi:hypothetical protein
VPTCSWRQKKCPGLGAFFFEEHIFRGLFVRQNPHHATQGFRRTPEELIAAGEG